jgi:hypothetical protein
LRFDRQQNRHERQRHLPGRHHDLPVHERDADSGTSAFTMIGGSLTSKSGHMFHVTTPTP